MAKQKKPKRPKATASISVWERYDKRLKDFIAKRNMKESEKKRKQSIIERTSKVAANL